MCGNSLRLASTPPTIKPVVKSHLNVLRSCMVANIVKPPNATVSIVKFLYSSHSKSKSYCQKFRMRIKLLSALILFFRKAAAEISFRILVGPEVVCAKFIGFIL